MKMTDGNCGVETLEFSVGCEKSEEPDDQCYNSVCVRLRVEREGFKESCPTRRIH